MQLVDILKSKYSETNYIYLVRDLLKDITPINHNIDIKSMYKQYIKECKLISSFIDNEGKKVAILTCLIKDESKARTIQRNFIAHELTTGELFDYDAALVAFYDSNPSSWKLSLITFDIEFNSKIVFKFKPSKRFSFLLGENEPSKTCLSQLEPIYNNRLEKPSLEDLKKAFSIVNVTTDFYKDYTAKFNELFEYLETNNEFIEEAVRLGYSKKKKDYSIDKFAITFAKKTLGQIVFLFFLQKKGWLGVNENDIWGNGDKEYIKNSLKNENGNYFDNFFEPLFYKALNVYREDELFKNKKIPFLNGGLFTPIKNYDWKSKSFNIPNNYFYNGEDGLVDIFSQYNFTINESDDREEEIAVDPEMLGKIFESLLDVSKRKEMGAFYTPRSIVTYMTQSSLARKISIKFNIDYDLVLNYICYHDVIQECKEITNYAYDIDQYLSNLKILEPAVGSGAFLLGILTEITKLRKSFDKYLSIDRSLYELKLNSIKNNLYGVDLEYDAIEIAKLRLWLSLIVDDISNNPKPLPNLNFNLLAGNSLIDSYHDVYFEREIKQDKRFKKINTLKGILNEFISKKHDFFNVHNYKEKKDRLTAIYNLRVRYIKEYLLEKDLNKLFTLLPELQDLLSKDSWPFMFWYLEFYDVFKDNDGFDIVIANPPYIGEDGNKDIFDPIKESNFGKKYYRGKMDIYYLFFHLALDLSNNDAVISFITTNYYVTADGALTLRNDFKERTSIVELINFNELTIFDSAQGQHNMITQLTKASIENCKIVNFEIQGKLSDKNIATIILNTMYSHDSDNTKYISQKELYYGKSNYIAIKQNYTDDYDTKVINLFSKCKIRLADIANVHQGIVSGANKVSKSNLLDGENLVLNDGIYVLDLENSNDIKFLQSLNDFEMELIKPYFKNSDIKKYSCNEIESKKIIYFENKNLDISRYPNIFAHLEKYKIILEKRLVTYNEHYNWYALHRPREQVIFDSKKIVIPYRANDTNFAYTESPWYFSTDAYCITEKNSNYDLKLLLGLLNSNAYKVWFKLRGKMKGNTYEFFYTPLTELPILEISVEDKQMITVLVDRILNNGIQNEKSSITLIDDIINKYIL